MLAVAGYVGLFLQMFLLHVGENFRWFWIAVVLVIVAHVFLIWDVRYTWQFSQAVRNGYVGFLLFHSALVLIVVATFVSEKMMNHLVRFCFMIISAGAIGAVSRYGVVRNYGWYVYFIATFGGLLLFWQAAQFIKSKLRP